MKDPYTEIGDIIEQWIIDNRYYYADYLVTLTLDDSLLTVILKYNGNVGEFEWDYDWWEGEKVELLGFIPVDDIHVHGNPLCADLEMNYMYYKKGEEE